MSQVYLFIYLLFFHTKQGTEVNTCLKRHVGFEADYICFCRKTAFLWATLGKTGKPSLRFLISLVTATVEETSTILIGYSRLIRRTSCVRAVL